jgi:hypothetical protein
MMSLDVIKTEFAERILNLKSSLQSNQPNQILNQFGEKAFNEVVEKGYSIVKGYKPESYVENVVSEIENIIETNDKIWRDDVGADNRIYFANHGSELIDDFYSDSSISDFVKIYEDSGSLVGFTLAAKISAKANNKGSGGGWHRDYFLRKQTKAILYLSDTAEENGPFQYLEGSHKYGNIKSYIEKYNFKFNQYRYSQKEVNQILDDTPNQLKTLTGKKGDLILVDTRGIHRGKPIAESERYALTNYFWANKPDVPAHIKKLNPFK